MSFEGAIILTTAPILISAALALPLRALAQQNPIHNVPAPTHGGTVVMLCDGKTSIELKKLKPGQKLTRAEGQAVSNALIIAVVGVSDYAFNQGSKNDSASNSLDSFPLCYGNWRDSHDRHPRMRDASVAGCRKPRRLRGTKPE
jgi:hypothetical protein